MKRSMSNLVSRPPRRRTVSRPNPRRKKASRGISYGQGTSVASVAYVAGENEWPVLPKEALYGLAGDVVRTIEPRSEADPVAILIQLLVAVGNMIGRKIHCKVESTRHDLNLFACLVGDTSTARKGTSWGHIRRLCSNVYPNWTKQRVTSGLSSAEGLIAEVRDVEPRRTRRLLVVQSEFASVLKMMQRTGNTLSQILRVAWDGGILRTLVKNSPLKATDAHISMIGHITQSELHRYFSDVEAHNGFANRVLWVCVKRSKLLPEGGSVPEDEFAEIAQRLKVVTAWTRQMGDHEMKRDDEARELWASEYGALSDVQPGLVGAATGRAAAQVHHAHKLIFEEE